MSDRSAVREPEQFQAPATNLKPETASAAGDDYSSKLVRRLDEMSPEQRAETLKAVEDYNKAQGTKPQQDVSSPIQGEDDDDEEEEEFDGASYIDVEGPDGLDDYEVPEPGTEDEEPEPTGEEEEDEDASGRPSVVDPYADGPIDDENLLDDEEPLEVVSDKRASEPGFSVPGLTGSGGGAGETVEGLHRPIGSETLARVAGGAPPPAPLTFEEVEQLVFAEHRQALSKGDPMAMIVTILRAAYERQTEGAEWHLARFMEVSDKSNARIMEAGHKLSEELYSQSAEGAASAIVSGLRGMADQMGRVDELVAVLRRQVRLALFGLAFLTTIIVMAVFAIYIILQ